MSFVNKITCCLLVFVSLTFFLRAQPGTIDLGFNSGDRGFGSGNGADNTIKVLAIREDGKILIGGRFTTYNNTYRNSIARLNPDGSLDVSFNPSTDANNISAFAIQPDGKILIGGGFTAYNGTTRNSIARLNIDGSLDLTFNPGIGANNWVNTISLQKDGKIIIGGFFTSYNGMARNSIARLNEDGSLDETFNSVTGSNNGILTLVVQPDGKVLIGGIFNTYNGSSRNCIARVNANGSLDESFQPGTGANAVVNSLVLQQDGKIMIGGLFTSYNGTSSNSIARLKADGTLDTSFHPGAGANYEVNTLILQPDGKILIGGLFTSYNGISRNSIARLNQNGTLDSSFNPGSGVNDVKSILVQLDGKILIGGAFTSYNGNVLNRIARLNADGRQDDMFNPTTGANNTVYGFAIQPNGKILVVGGFTVYNNTQRNSILRLNEDGSLDSTFNPGTGANFSVTCILLQLDGKILIGGWFSLYNGISRNYIARLNEDGSLDSTFNPGSGANGGVMALALQPDGKILIGGWFNGYNGTSRNSIARLNTDGTLDSTFNPGSGTNSVVDVMLLQPDGKILIGGGFTSYNGISRYRIARIYADGELDASFNPGSGTNNFVNKMILLKDGKILIGGSFSKYDGISRNSIARINQDGTLDGTFDAGTWTGRSVYSLGLQSNGKVLIGGMFTAYNSFPRNNFARLKADGTLDVIFDPGTGTNNSVFAIEILPDGKILVGGTFTSYNGIGRNGIARIIGDSDTPTSMRDFVLEKGIRIYPNPVALGNRVLVTFNQLHAGRYTIVVYDAIGAPVLKQAVQHRGGNFLYSLHIGKGISSGIYIVAVASESGNKTSRRILVQ